MDRTKNENLLSSEDKQFYLQKITAKLVAFTAIILVMLTILVYLLLSSEAEKQKPFLAVLVYICGLLGGFVSIQQRLPKISTEEIKALSTSWVSITLIPINGGIFSLVLMFMFIGNIIQGSLFPEYPDIEIKTISDFYYWVKNGHPVSGEDVSKLLFWSFIAGFSERFVPQVIMKATNQVDDENKLNDNNNP